MQWLKNIIDILFSKYRSDNQIAEKSKYLCEINFKLLHTNQVDIEILPTDIAHSSMEDISFIAENCANLLVLINNGLLRKEILNSIKNKKKTNMNNAQITLLYDNMLFFHNLLEEELQMIKKESGPIIRPSAVFKSIE